MKPIPLAHSPTTEVRTVPLRLPNSALSNARTPYPGGSREADRGREARSLGPAGRAHDPPRLPARVARWGGGRSPVGANRLRGRGLARSPDQEWVALHASPHRSRTPRPTTASAREQPKPLRLCLGTRRSPQPCGVQSDGGARREGRRPGSKGPRTHAAPRLRLRTSERGARHEGLAGVPRAPEYPEHGEIFRACAWALLGVLAGLARRRSPGCTHGPGLPRLNDQSPY